MSTSLVSPWQTSSTKLTAAVMTRLKPDLVQRPGRKHDERTALYDILNLFDPESRATFFDPNELRVIRMNMWVNYPIVAKRSLADWFDMKGVEVFVQLLISI